MKKRISLFFLLLCICVTSGCVMEDGTDRPPDTKSIDTETQPVSQTADTELPKTDDRISKALKELEKQWSDYQILNTRIITVKENRTEIFSDIDYIVEFVLFTDYYGSTYGDGTPYYSNAGVYDTVIVYKDGSAALHMQNPFHSYRARTYSSDFTQIIEKIEDFGNLYNNVR